MADENKETSLTAAVAQAVTDTPVPEESTQPEQETKDAGKENESSSEEPQLELQDIQDAEQGKVLIRALRDPNTSLQVIDYIARQSGYTKIETKQEVKAAARDINSILEENLGEEFKFLAPKLGPAIKESLEALLESKQGTSSTQVQALQARLEKQELKEIQQETQKTHVAISQEYFGSDDMPDNVVKAMSKAMDEFPPTDASMTPERYYRRIFQLVSGELGLSKKNARAASGSSSDKITRNQNDSVARNLTSQSRGIVPTEGTNGPRKLSLKDAVQLAVAQVDQQGKK